MVDYKAIGRRISIYRKNKELTQADFSEQLGVSESYISQVECGSAKISLTRLYQIAEILDTDIALLVSNQAIINEIEFNSEIFEIIKNWDNKKITFLTKLLMFADNELKDDNE